MSSDLILAISTIFLALFTLVLTVFTYFLYSEAKKSRTYQVDLNRPELSVSFEPSSKYIEWIDIHIKNIGKSPIYDLELEEVKGEDLICFNGKKVSDLEFLKKINYLRPEQEIVQFFYNFVNSQKKPDEIQFELYFRYYDKDKNVYKRKFVINFNQFMDMSQIGEEPLYQISKNIKEIRDEVHYLSSGFHKLNVITQTKKEKQSEEKENLKKIQRRQKLAEQQKKNENKN